MRRDISKVNWIKTFDVNAVEKCCLTLEIRYISLRDNIPRKKKEK